MASREFVLVEKETGDEYTFTNRGAFLSALYSGGYREKKDQPRAEAPRQQRRREPVNDSPTVETARGE